MDVGVTEPAARIDPRLETFIRRMPKAEIHIHLEGSVRPGTLLELARRNGVQPPADDEAGLRDFFRFRNFPHFIEVYIAVCNCLRTPEDFATIVRELGEDAAAQNIRYLEIHFNPETNVRKRGLDFHAMLAGMNRGRAAARERWGVEMRWIADGVRDSETSPFSVTRTVDWISDLSPDDGVVALGLGATRSAIRRSPSPPISRGRAPPGCARWPTPGRRLATPRSAIRSISSAWSGSGTA